MTRPLVALTGATGFIGRRLAQLLTDAGYAVRGLTRQPAPATRAHLTWVSGQLEDRKTLSTLLAGAEAVVHCAGAIKALSRDGFMAVNAGATRTLAEIAAAQEKPPRFVLLSSLAARHPMLSSYATSKQAGEAALTGYRDAVILRPSAVYGPGDMETLRIFQMAARGFLLRPFGPARTSLIHVDDVAAATIAALQLTSAAAEPVEIDDGRGGYAWPEIAAAAGEALGTRPRLVPLPSPLVYAAGAFGTLRARLTGRATVLGWDKVPELLHPDWSVKSINLPGFSPAWSLQKGFKNAANWYASRGLLRSNG